MTPTEEAAIHEAGHACTALLLKEPFGAAIHRHGNGAVSGSAGPGDLAEPPDFGAFTLERMELAVTGEPLVGLMRDAVITAGGCVAVAMARRELRARVRGLDRTRLTALAWAACPDADFDVDEAFTALAVARARSLLRRSWFRVQAVAAALAEAGRLSAEDVARVFAEAKGGEE